MLFEIWSSCDLGYAWFPRLQEESKTHSYVLTLTDTITQEHNAQNIFNI